MRTVPSSVRSAALALAAGVLVTGAAVSSGTVRLSAPHERAGLVRSSDILLAETALLCPGQARQGAEGLRDVAGIVQAATVAAPADLVPGNASTTGGSLELRSLPGGARLVAGSARARLVAAAIDRPLPRDAVAARATGSLAPGLVATQTWLRTTDDDRGLAVTPCSLPAADLWLVGGGGGPARTERVVLTNPGANAVTVRLDVRGAGGRIEAAADRSVSIAPRSRAVVALDAVAPGETAPAVHVVATGGTVSGVLVDSWIDGATARGTDDVGGAAVGTDLVVPGVEIAGAETPGAGIAGAATLRLVNPGTTEAVAQVRLLTETSPVQLDSLRAVRIGPSSTRDVPLTAPPKGVAGVQIVSDQPVTAGVWVERRASSGEDRMGDFGWASATTALRDLGGLVLPQPGPSRLRSTLVLAAGRMGGTATVTTLSGGRTTTTAVSLAAGAVRRMDLAGAEVVWVAPTTGGVHAAVSVVGGSAASPLFSVAALASAPVTALSMPVRQVGR